jgi:hypothetical protein
MSYHLVGKSCIRIEMKPFELANIPNSFKSRNTSRNYKSEKEMDEQGAPDMLKVGSGD